GKDISKCVTIRRFLTLFIKILDIQILKRATSWFWTRTSEKLDGVVRRSTLYTKFTKFCFPRVLFFGEKNKLSCMSNLVMDVQRYTHVLDNTLVRTASLVGRKESMQLKSDSGSLLILSPLFVLFRCFCLLE
ncbi:hypothetical protein VIGAN_07212400, partial [Vigna angularis var. angularis]